MNTSLIPITKRHIGAAHVPTVNARELHAFLEVGKDFSTWLKDRIEQYGFIVGCDFVEVFPAFGGNSKAGRPAKEYALTFGMAKELSMVERNAKGKQARQYFIECERQAKVSAALPTIKDPHTAALIHALTRVDALEQAQQQQSGEVQKLREDVAVIEARTQPENCHFTVLGYAKLHGQKIDVPTASRLGRRCAQLSRQHGLPIGDVHDPRFGKVHTYHDRVNPF